MPRQVRTPFIARSRVQRSSLAAIAATTLVMSFALAAIIGWGWRTPDVAVRQTLESTSAAESSVVVKEDLASDSSRQDASVRQTIAATFRDAPVDVARTVVDGPWPLAGAMSDTTVLFVRSPMSIQSRGSTAGDIRAVKGSVAELSKDSPGSKNSVAIDAAGAKALRVGVGDTLTVTLNSGDAVLRIVAVWEPRNPKSLAWASAPVGADGTTARLIAGASTIAAVASTPQARWAVAPSADRVGPGDLDSLAYGFSHLGSAVSRHTLSDAAAPTVAGTGAEQIAAMQRSLDAVGEVLPVPIAVLSLSAVVAIVLLAILLAGARATETRLLRARGASLSTFVRLGVIETFAIAFPGAIVGSLAAQLVLFVVFGPPTNTLEPLIAPCAATATAVLATTMVGAIFARETTGADRAESGRARTTVFISIAVLLGATAGLTLWRFLQYGVPAPGQRADPSGVLAPAALLSALAVFGLLLLTPLTSMLERRSVDSTGIERVLPARQLRRNTLVFAGPVALLILAIGASTLAAGYSATCTSFLAGSSKLLNGSDVRVAFADHATASDATVLIDRAAYDKIQGAASVTPVLRTDASAGDYSLSVIGLPAGRLGALAGSSGEDPQRLAASILPGQSPLTGVVLPAGAGHLSFEMTAVRSDDQTSPKLSGARAFATAWLVDSVGDITPVTLPGIPITAKSASLGSTVRVALPRGGPWMLVALDVGVSAPTTLRGLEVTVASLAADAPVTIPAGQDWVPQPAVFDASSKAIAGSNRIAFSRASVSASGVDRYIVRLMPKGSATVPVVISGSMASVANLTPGDSADVDGTWASFRVKVAGIAALVPGASGSPALLADLRSLENSMLRTSPELPAVDELWMSAADPQAVASSATTIAGPSSTVTVATGSLQGSFMSAAVVGLWIGAVGGAFFAFVALGAALAVFTRRRVGEVFVLRALGLSGADQVRMRRSEIVIIAAYSVVVGVIAGALTCLLTVPTLTRLSSAVAAQALPIAPRLDAGLLAALILALAVATALVVLWVTRSVRAAAAGVPK